MAKITLYEKVIESNAKRFSRQFPEQIREYARKTIENLLENARDLALVDGHTKETENFYYLDKGKYRAEFERNCETVGDYCTYVVKSEKPLAALKVLAEPEYIPLIRLFKLRQTIKTGLPSNIEELRKELEFLRKLEEIRIQELTEKAEKIEKSQSRIKYASGFYKKGPFDSRPDYFETK